MAPLLAIEFTEQESKVVVAELGRGKTVVRDAFRLALPRSEDATQRVAERAKALREALATRKIKACRAHVMVPKNYVMARMVTLPSINDDELAGMARFEAERHIPFNAERHVVSHYVLNKLVKGLLGTNNLDTNSRLCMSSAVAGYKVTLGSEAGRGG